jgi:hypothetical protein
MMLRERPLLVFVLPSGVVFIHLCMETQCRHIPMAASARCTGIPIQLVQAFCRSNTVVGA